MRDRILRRLTRERLIVTLKTGETFDGLLEQADANTIELVDAHMRSPEARAKVDGRLYLPRADVAYAQRVEGV